MASHAAVSSPGFPRDRADHRRPAGASRGNPTEMPGIGRLGIGLQRPLIERDHGATPDRWRRATPYHCRSSIGWSVLSVAAAPAPSPRVTERRPPSEIPMRKPAWRLGIPLRENRLVRQPRPRRPDHGEEGEGVLRQRRHGIDHHEGAGIDPLPPSGMAPVDRGGNMDEFEPRPFGIAVAMDDPHEPRLEPVALLHRELEGDGLAGSDRVAVGIADDLQHGRRTYLAQSRKGRLMSSPVCARQRRRKTSHSASSRLVKTGESSI